MSRERKVGRKCEEKSVTMVILRVWDMCVPTFPTLELISRSFPPSSNALLLSLLLSRSSTHVEFLILLPVF